MALYCTYRSSTLVTPCLYLLLPFLLCFGPLGRCSLLCIVHWGSVDIVLLDYGEEEDENENEGEGGGPVCIEVQGPLHYDR